MKVREPPREREGVTKQGTEKKKEKRRWGGGRKGYRSLRTREKNNKITCPIKKDRDHERGGGRGGLGKNFLLELRGGQKNRENEGNKMGAKRRARAAEGESREFWRLVASGVVTMGTLRGGGGGGRPNGRGRSRTPRHVVPSTGLIINWCFWMSFENRANRMKTGKS